MKESYTLEECNAKGFKGSIDDYIACIKNNDISAIEEKSSTWLLYKDYKAELDFKAKQEADLAKWYAMSEEEKELWKELWKKERYKG